VYSAHLADSPIHPTFGFYLFHCQFPLVSVEPFPDMYRPYVHYGTCRRKPGLTDNTMKCVTAATSRQCIIDSCSLMKLDSGLYGGLI